MSDLFRFDVRRIGWLRWEVVYETTTDTLVRPVSGIPLYWSRLAALGAVDALRWAHNMGDFIASEREQPR